MVSQFKKEEIRAGISAGVIRAMGAIGGVVTAAGLVFAVTMASLASITRTAIKEGGNQLDSACYWAF